MTPVRRRILIVLGFVALTIGCLVWIVSQPGAPLKVTASFIGYTNNPAGARLGMLAITNNSNIRVVRWDFFHRGTEERKGLYPVFLGSSAVLAPKQSEILLVPTPTNQVRWQAGIDICRDDWRRKFSLFVGDLPSPIKALIPQKAQGVQIEVAAVTDWIDP
jgi:hypothetical protein